MSISISACGASTASLQQLNQFIDLGALVDRIAAGDRAFHALAEMLLEDVRFHLGQGGADRLQLVQDVDAIAALGHHPGDAAHLPLDSVEAADKLWIMVRHNAFFLYPMGVSCNIPWRGIFGARLNSKLRRKRMDEQASCHAGASPHAHHGAKPGEGRWRLAAR